MIIPMQISIPFILTFLAALVCGIIIAPPCIRFLTRLKCGQEIRDEGPEWHKVKSGTPTMGGMIFILSGTVSALIATLLINGKIDLNAIMLIFLSVSFGVVGFVDDFIKVKLKRNLGLTEIQKLLLQIAASILFVWVLRGTLVSTELIIPFAGISVQLGWWYLPLAVLAIISTVNAVNLTDGLDGLASSVTIVVTMFFVFVAYLQNLISISVFGCAMLGGVAAFLIFNKYPAKVFMGDTGSLFLGGALCGMAILSGTPLFLIISGGIFVVEALSVIIQVASFKLTGKRVFKMAPLHHHFEKCGFKETKIVIIFTLVSLLLSLIAFGGFIIYLK